MPAPSSYLTSLNELFSTYAGHTDVQWEVLDLANLLLIKLVDHTPQDQLDDQAYLQSKLKQLTRQLHTPQQPARLVRTFIQHQSLSQAAVMLGGYLLALSQNGCSASTLKNYRSDINQFFAFTANSSLNASLTKPKVASFLKWQHHKGLTTASIKRKVVALTQFAEWLEQKEVVPPGRFAWLPKLNANFDTVFDELISEKSGNKTQKYLSKNKSQQQKTAGTAPVVLSTHQLQNTADFTKQKPNSTPIQSRQEHRHQLKQAIQDFNARWANQARQSLLPYINLLLSLLLFLGMGYFAYLQFFTEPDMPLAYPTSLTRPNRTLSFQGRLTDTAQNPITGITAMRFQLYDEGPSTTSGNILWDSTSCNVDPDQDGIFSVGLGSECGGEITENVFSENSNVWLQVEIESEVLNPRQSIKTVPYALNAETVQGYPASASAVENTVLVMDNNGEIVLGNANPVLKSTGDSFAIEAQTLTLRTAAGFDGDIVLAPDGDGKSIAQSDLDVTGFIHAPGATFSANYAGGIALVLQAGPSATADIMRWNSSTGTQLGVIDEGGNVGIGTSDPAGKLHINTNGDAVIGQIIRANSGSQTANLSEWQDHTGSTLTYFTPEGYLGMNGNLALKVPSVDTIMIGNTGNTANSGVNNFFAGYGAGSSNTSGHSNLFLGKDAGHANTTADYNLFIGSSAGAKTVDGGKNTFIGRNAGLENVSGEYNIFLGTGAGQNSTVSYNTAIGSSSLFTNTTGGWNTAIGYGSLYNNTDGEHNTSIGYASGYYNQGGDQNVFIGFQAGRGPSAQSISGNVFIGYQAGYNETTSNKLYIENSNSSSPLIYGDFATDVVGIHGSLGIGTTSPSSLFSVGASSQFQVDSNGDIVKLKNLTYSWPSSHVTDGFLKNDGSGNLVWTTNITANALKWNALTNPDDNLSLSMGAYTTSFTWGATTGAGVNLFNLADTTNNTGTGYLLNIATATGSTLQPLRVAAAGVEALAIDADGNVGIGTTSPTSKLDISGAITSSNVGAGSVLLSTNYAEALNLATNQHPTPNNSLTALGIYDADPSKYFFGSYDLSGGSFFGMKRDGAYEGAFGLMFDDWASTTYGFTSGGTGLQFDDGYIDFYTYGELTAQFSNTYMFRMFNSGSTTIELRGSGTSYINAGNLGIGTTSPSSLFSVGASSQFQVDSNGDIVKLKNLTYSWPSSHVTDGFLKNDGSGNLVWTTNITANALKWNALTNPDDNLSLSMGAYTTSFTWGATTGAGVNLFNLADTTNNTGTGYLLNIATATGSTLQPLRVAAAGVEALAIDETGNVGIGTTSPTQKIDVSGKIALGGTVVAYRPTTMTGTLILGDGGTNLTHPMGPHGYYNTFVGLSSGVDNTSGYSNSSLGYSAFENNTTGFSNVALGTWALGGNTTGTNNIAVGASALSANITGQNNIAVGSNAGLYTIYYGTNESTSNSIYIGHYILSSNNGADNEIAIGNYSQGLGDNTINIGTDSFVATALHGNVGIGTTSPTFKLNLAAATTAAGGIGFGTDTNLYRSAANTLKTDDNLVVGTLGAGATDTVVTHSSGTLQTRTIDSRVWGTSLVDGSGTNNYLAKWTPDSNSIGNSVVYDNGTNVGIGTTTPTAKLHVINDDERAIHGESFDNQGVYGKSTNDSGVYGYGVNYVGVRGYSTDGYGVWGSSANNWGVYGSSQYEAAVVGQSSSKQSGYFYRNSASPTTPNFEINTLNAADDQTVLYIAGSGTGDLINVFDGASEVFTIVDGGNVGIGTTSPAFKLDVAGVTRVQDLITQSLTLSSLSTSIITGHYGHDGYTNFSGGIGTGGIGKDGITGAQRITSQGNLVNIGSIQAGELLLTSGGTFATKVDYPTGTSPYSVAIGDVNGDGKADLEVTNWSSKTVSVFINNGDGTFATKVDYTTGTAPYSVAIGDLNGDGKADLAVANNSSTSVSVFINNGDGTFATKVDYPTGSWPRSVAIGDVNGDGKADLAVANNGSHTVSVFINNGDGTFATKVDYTTGSGPHSVAVGDVNGDGKADLVAANHNSTSVSVLINNGDGTFATKVDYGTGSWPRSVAVGDVNGDGKADLAVVNYASNSISVLINNGDGTFATKVDYGTGTAPFSVAVGDVNGDGKADLAVANSSSSSVSVLMNNASPMFYAQARTGRVGIGSITPQTKLQIFGSDNATNPGEPTNAALRIVQNATGGYDRRGEIQFAFGSDDRPPSAVIAGKYTSWTSGWTTVLGASLAFATTPVDGTLTDRMIITHDGNVGIGTTSPGYRLELPNVADATGRGRANSWTTYSDMRLKENLNPVSNALEKVGDLNPVYFDWKGQGIKDIGLIAQEVELIIPEITSTGGDGYMSIDYSRLSPLLIAAIQEQQLQIENLNTILAFNANKLNITSNHLSLLSFSSTGDLVLAGSNGNYSVTATPTGTKLSNVLAGAQAVIGRITAGLVNTQELVVNRTASIANLSVNTLKLGGQNITDYISSIVDQRVNQQMAELPAADATSSAEIATLDVAELTADNSTINALTSDKSILGELLAETATISGDLTVAGSTRLGSFIADSATVSGTLVANRLVLGDDTSSESAEPNLEVKGFARIAQLESKMATLEKIKATTAELTTATVSGTLYANNIYNIDQMIAANLQQPGLLDTLLGNYTAPEAADPTAVYDPIEAAGYEPINPELLATSLANLQLEEEDVVLGATAILVERYFQVNGTAYVAENLGIGELLQVGSGLMLADGMIEYAPAGIDQPILSIQPSGRGRLEMLAGLMSLENGRVEITGELKVAGSVEVENTLLTDLIAPTDFGNPLQVQVAGIATESGMIKQTRFEIVDESGQAVASFDAEGNADFAGGIGVGKDDLTLAASINDVVTTNSTSGKAVLPASKSQLTIQTNQIKEDSLIYITPRGSTRNQVLYVKSQVNGSFTVGLDKPIENDVEFNWWIVQ